MFGRRCVACPLLEDLERSERKDGRRHETPGIPNTEGRSYRFTRARYFQTVIKRIEQVRQRVGATPTGCSDASTDSSETKARATSTIVIAPLSPSLSSSSSPEITGPMKEKKKKREKKRKEKRKNCARSRNALLLSRKCKCDGRTYTRMQEIRDRDAVDRLEKELKETSHL